MIKLIWYLIPLFFVKNHRKIKYNDHTANNFSSVQLIALYIKIAREFRVISESFIIFYYGSVTV